MKIFPAGGPREPVYEFMRSRGFVMSKWSDKVWSRADGLEASIYGAGSEVRVNREGKSLADGPLFETLMGLPLSVRS